MSNAVDTTFDKIIDDLVEMRDELYAKYTEAKDKGKLVKATEYGFQALGIQNSIDYLQQKM